MRISIASLLLAAIVAGADPSWAQTVPAPPIDGKPGTIRGRITAADTGKPLRRARVTIRPQAPGAPPTTANTNSLGQFEATNVPAGAYFISAARAGYLETQYGQRRPAERGVTVEVAPAHTVDRIDISLPRGAVLTGRITDELGEPYPGVRVDAVALGYRLGKRVPSPAGVATTDDLGQFRIAGLPPGSYYVVASSAETWAAEKKQTHGYASTYFPGGPRDLAQVISLGASQQRDGLNFSLLSGRTARITGRVEREDGQPSSGAQVTLAYSYPGSGSIMTYGMRSVRAAADGAFEIKDVSGGAYSVMAGGDGRDVTVAGADIDDVVLTARTVSTVIGTVITEDRVPPPFSPSGVRIVADAPLGKVLPRMGNVSVENDWSFKYGLGGPFLFRVIGLPDGWTVRAVRLGDKDISDTPWDVPTGGKEIGGLTVVVTQSISRVSGTVVDTTGKPMAAATVVVFPEESALWVPYSRLIRVARPTTDGRFSVTGLPAGTYRAIARESIEEGQWEDRAFLEEVRDDAVRFVLADGGSQAIALKLPPPR